MAAHFVDHLRSRSIANAEVTAVVGAAGIASAFALSADHIENGPTICPFRLATGLPCPGCGLTRSWVYLAHGRWTDSVIAHPFGVVAAALVVALIVTVVRARARGDDPPELMSSFAVGGSSRSWAAGLPLRWAGCCLRFQPDDAGCPDPSARGPDEAASQKAR